RSLPGIVFLWYFNKWMSWRTWSLNDSKTNTSIPSRENFTAGPGIRHPVLSEQIAHIPGFSNGFAHSGQWGGNRKASNALIAIYSIITPLT
ncbi:MAG: hypothetical protein O3B73_19330, partial [bacterium]|nr:hypothetical protein [bacterium]